MRLAERTALVVGLVLLAGYAVGMLDRTAGSRLDVDEFATRHDPSTQNPSGQQVDFGLWSEKRIREFRQSLSLVKDPPIAVLSVGRLRIEAPIFQGTSDLILNRGLGWIEGTPKPGSDGNSGIAGHRDGFFRALKDIAVGDLVELNTGTAKLAYRADEVKIVSPEDVWVLAPRAGPSLTLVTCYPFYFVGDAPKRFIVHARLQRASVTGSSLN